MAQEALPDDAIVVRFRPWSSERLLEDAEITLRVQIAAGVEPADAHTGLSVWATLIQEGETGDGALKRLTAEAETDGIQKNTNPKFRWARLEDIRAVGWDLVKEDSTGEKPSHYCLTRGGNTVDAADVERVMEAFDSRAKWE